MLKPQMGALSERDQDFESDFDVDSEDGFDALEIESPVLCNRTVDFDTSRVTSPSAIPSQATADCLDAHRFHSCQRCCLWDPFVSPSTSLRLYTLRDKDALCRGSVGSEPCAFLHSIRRRMRGLPIPDDARLFLKTRSDEGNAEFAFGCQVEFFWGSGTRQGELVAGSGQVHPVAGPKGPCTCKGEVIRPRPCDLEGSLAKAKEELRVCEESHTSCLKQQQFAPLRLVQIHSPTHVILSAPEDKVVQYAALSYCWGGPQECTTSTRNIKERSVLGFLISSLSKTLQEAIEVTRAMGLEYLWTDCLCIIQDSEDDKEQQISQMPDIYAGAYFTIAASCGRSSSSGFLESRSMAVNLFRFELSPMRTIFVAISNSNSDGIEPLDTRAWALQEKILSKRILNFKTDMVVVECAAGSLRTHSPNPNIVVTGRRILDLQSFLVAAEGEKAEVYSRFWRHLVVNYTGRSLTLPDDRLLAISGVANRLASYMEGKYLAGIWESDLHRDLMWRCDDPRQRPESERAPSWSWAAIDGPVSFNILNELLGPKNLDEKSHQMKIHGASLLPSHQSAKYGAVRPGGYITISGFIRPVKIVRQDDKRTIIDPSSNNPMRMTVSFDTVSDNFTDAYLLNYFMSDKVDLRTAGLLIIRLPDSYNGFRRIGLYDAQGTTDWFTGFEETLHLY